MGRKTDVLLRGFRAAKCLTLLKLATARIKVLRNKRSISAKQMRGEIAQLLKSGQDAHVYITKADALIKQENMVAFYDLIDQYCHAIIGRFPMIELQSTCPIDMKEPIASLIFAAPRCVELSELASIKEAFIAKYGKEFAAAASELRPDCGVNKQVIELLSTRPATGDMKVKIMKEICVEHDVNWTPGENLTGSATSLPVGSSQQPVKTTKVEATKVTGDAGSSKVEAPSVRVSEAGPSNFNVGAKPASQGGSKHEGVVQSGFAAVTPLKHGVPSADTSKSSGTKLNLSPGGAGSSKVEAPSVRVSEAGPSNFNVGAKPALQGASKHQGVVQSGFAAVESSKHGVLSADASKSSGMKLNLSPGDAGSSKVEAPSVRISEAGPLNFNVSAKPASQGGSKHGVVKSGFAAVEPLKHGVPSADVSNSSGMKLNLSPEKDVGKASATVLQSPKGSANTGIPSVKTGLAAAGSLKTGDGAVFAATAFKKSDTKEEGIGGASVTALQSLKGGMNTATISGSFNQSKGEPVRKAEAYVQTVVAAQDGTSDSDSDSFVSVEEGRFEEDAEGSFKGGAARRESFGKNSPVKGDVNGPSLIEQPSRETWENSSSTMRPHEDVYSKASSKKSSFAMESSQEDMLLRASFKDSLNTGALEKEKPFGAESRKNSLREEKSTGLIMEISQEDAFRRASRKNSLNAEALQEEKPFRAESRKSSLREEKITDLTLEISHEDAFRRASSKNSTNTETLLEEKAFRADSRKSSLREKVAEEQSFKQVSDNSLMEEQLKEEQHFEASVEEGVQRKDLQEGIALGRTESSTACGLYAKGIIEDSSFVATSTESSLEENLVKMKKNESFSYGITADEISSGANEEVSLNIKKLPENVSKQTDGLPPSGKGEHESVGSASLGAIATPDDFAAAAKAIAEEAARLAVLDYAKRITGSSTVPIDLTDLTNFGLNFEGIPKGSQETKQLHGEGKSVLDDSQDVRQEGESTIDVIQKETSKVELTVNDAEGINSGHAKFDEMGYIWDANMEKSMHSKMSKADDGVFGNNANSNTLGNAPTLTKDESLEQPDMSSGNDDINPFAMGMDKATNSLFSETGEDDNSRWFNQTKPELTSKAGGFGQDEDHLDIFFKRKTPRFDEDGYSFVNVNPGFLEERVPYHGYDKKESISQDKFFVSTPVFDSFPERQSMPVEESSGSFKSPVFDDGGAEADDASFSFNDGLDKSTLSVGLSDQKRPQSSSNNKVFASFDPEPEPIFDKVVDEEEQSSIEKRESTQVGQLKWQSKKAAKASEQLISGETLASDTSSGVASNPMSRRSRKQPQRIDDYGYDIEIPAQAKLFTDGGVTSQRPQGSFITQMQQQHKDQGKKEKYDADKDNLRTKPAESRSDAMNKRPSTSPKRMSDQHKYDLSEESQPDRWDSTSSVEDRFPSTRPKRSPIRSSQRQKVQLDERDEDFYFGEEIGNSTAASSMSRKTTKSPTRPLPQGYDDDDDEGYKYSNKPSRQPNFSQHDLVDDDSTKEEPVPRYKPSKQSDDLSQGTSASSAVYRQKPYRQQEDYRSETLHTEYAVTGVGKINPTSRPSAWRKQQEEEDDLASGYRPSVQVDDFGKSSSSRLISSRTKVDEKPHLASRYKPSAQIDDSGRVSSSPLSGHQQRYRLPQEEELEASMEQYEQEESYSMPLPHRQQGERHKEKKRIPKPIYGQKPDFAQEKDNSDSSIEDYEQQQEDQRRPSMFSEPEKQRQRYGQEQDRQETIHRPLPPYRQEKQRRPLPQLYDQEEEFRSTDGWQEERLKVNERISRPPYRQKQDSRLEKESVDLSIEEYEQHQEEKRHSSMLSEQEQGRQEKQHQRLPPYGQAKQRWPTPPLQQSEWEEEKEEFHSKRLPDWRREEHWKEKEVMSKPLYGQKQDSRLEKVNGDLFMEDFEQQQEDQQHTSMRAEQEQEGQDQQRRPSRRRLDLKPGKEESGTWQQEKIRQEQQQPSPDRQQQLKLSEEAEKQQQQGREKERLPSLKYTRQEEIQEKKKSSEFSTESYKLQREEQLHYSTALPEGRQEQDGEDNEKRPWPRHTKKKESKLEKESSELRQQEGALSMQQNEPPSGRKQQSLAKEEGGKGQQERSEIKERLPAKQSLSKDERVKGSQEKPEIKAQPPAKQPPSLLAQSTSGPLESSVSDPVILATIPPPVKKPVVKPVPAATTLESSVSAPPPTSVSEVNDPKMAAPKLPKVEDLLTNFEAFRRARKGE